MNNGRWRKLLTALDALGGVPLRWKFLDDDCIASESPPYEMFAKHLDGTLQVPYGLHRVIDGIEIPSDQADAVGRAFDAVGKFPVIKTPTALRLFGYGRSEAN